MLSPVLSHHPESRPEAAEARNYVRTCMNVRQHLNSRDLFLELWLLDLCLRQRRLQSARACKRTCRVGWLRPWVVATTESQLFSLQKQACAPFNSQPVMSDNCVLQMRGEGVGEGCVCVCVRACECLCVSVCPSLFFLCVCLSLSVSLSVCLSVCLCVRACG